MLQYTLLSCLATLCAVLVVGQCQVIRMTDARVLSSVLRRSQNGGGNLCTVSRAGVTTCAVKSAEYTRFNATFVVDGGVNHQTVRRLLITMQLGDLPDIVTRALTCQVAGGGGFLVINAAAARCSGSDLAEGRHRVVPYRFYAPAVNKPEVVDLKIWADVVDWSGGPTNRNWYLGSISVQVFP